MKKLILPLLLASTACAYSASTYVGINFTDSTDTPFGAASAGAPDFAQANWNFYTTDWSGNGANNAVHSGLQTSTAAGASHFQNISYGVHSDPVHFDANNTWRSGSGNANPNATLMNGYLDDGGGNQPYVNVSLANYIVDTTVVLYIHGDVANGNVGRYWLEEWTNPLTDGTVITDQVGITGNDYTGTFSSAGSFSQTGTPSNVNVAGGNYIVFENVTAHNIRIRSSGNGDPEDFGRGPLNAIQIITVPEPSSSLLLCMGIASFLLRRRK